MKVESFIVEQSDSFFGSSKQSREKTALNFAISKIEENYKEGFNYRCNYDAEVDIKPGCMRKVIRFVMRKEKEEVIRIKFKYAIFEKNENPMTPCKFIEIKPVSSEFELGVTTNKKNVDPYVESGRLAIEEFLQNNPKIKPYCDLEAQVKFKPGCFKRIFNKIGGNGYKNKFSYDYFSFNIAQDFKV